MSGAARDVEALQAEVEQTRQELAETVDRLAAKLDVRTRAREAMTADDGRPTRAAMVAAAIVAVGAAATIALVVRRRG